MGRIKFASLPGSEDSNFLGRTLYIVQQLTWVEGLKLSGLNAAVQQLTWVEELKLSGQNAVVQQLTWVEGLKLSGQNATVQQLKPGSKDSHFLG